MLSGRNSLTELSVPVQRLAASTVYPEPQRRGSRASGGLFAMIFGTDIGVPLSPPSLASVSQMLEQLGYFLAHPREDIPSGIGS
jgi:hypothetical protein